MSLEIPSCAEVGRRFWVSSGMGAGFSITAGTLFSSHKLPLISPLSRPWRSPAISHFVEERVRFASQALRGDGSALKVGEMGGDGNVAEIDGGCFGG